MIQFTYRFKTCKTKIDRQIFRNIYVLSIKCTGKAKR